MKVSSAEIARVAAALVGMIGEDRGPLGRAAAAVSDALGGLDANELPEVHTHPSGAVLIDGPEVVEQEAFSGRGQRFERFILHPPPRQSGDKCPYCDRPY